MKRITSLCTLLFCTLLLTGCASGAMTGSEAASSAAGTAGTEPAETESAAAEPAGTIPAETAPVPLAPAEITAGEKEGWFSCEYAGIRHDMILDLPENPAGAPLIVMLPGYGGTAESFRSLLHLEEQAVPRGYAVLYVTGAPSPDDPTSSNGWNSGLAPDGNPDTAFLTALALSMQETYGLDPARTFAAGFSNGGFMMHRLAMEAGDVFSAVASVAGMMPALIWENRNAHNAVGFFQITGEKDDVVPKNSDGSAKHTDNPAIEDVISYWAESNGLSDAECCTVGERSVLTKYTGSGSTKQVWALTIPGGRHSWPNGDYNGVDANTLILDFFDMQ